MAGGGNEMSRGRGLFQFLAISLKRKQKRKNSLVTGSKSTRMQTKLMIAKWVNVLYSVCVWAGGEGGIYGSLISIRNFCWSLSFVPASLLHCI